MVMNMEMPELKEPMQIVMIFDPPAGKVIILDPKNKKEMVRDMPQVHCAPAPAAPDFSELSKAGMKVTDLGTKDFGELHATGYRIGIDLPVTGPKGAPVADAKPAGMEMVLWMDLSESIPVSMTMKVADKLNMDMEFTNVKLGEPSPAEFKIPAGYTEVKIPNLEIPDEKAAPPAPSKP
jgi:outer membrane lipoprotein-sorting protein